MWPTFTGKLSNSPRTQQLVQVEQLAALALPAHPHALTRVEDAVTMQQKEAPPAGHRYPCAVLAFSLFDEPNRQLHQRIAYRSAAAATPNPADRSASEVKIRVLVREIACLQLFDQLSHLLLIQQQRGNRRPASSAPAEFPWRNPASAMPAALKSAATALFTRSTAPCAVGQQEEKRCGQAAQIE